MTTTLLTDEEIISAANFISTDDFLASNLTGYKSANTVIGMLNAGLKVAIVFWLDGAKAYIPIPTNRNLPADSVLIKAYRTFHEVLNNKPSMEGQVWVKI